MNLIEKGIPPAPKKEKDPTADRCYCKVTAATSLGLVTDYLSGENEQDIREVMAKKYSMEEEIESIHTEPISKEEFVKKVKQKYAIRGKRKRKDW